MGEEFPFPAYPPLPGEAVPPIAQPSSFIEEIKEKKLTYEQASHCLHNLGKDETGSRYAYLSLTATDMKLTDVGNILKFRHVFFVDLSGNYLTIESLDVLAAMPFLILLKAERNRVESVGLETMAYLQVLDLNQNQIKELTKINQPLLETLELNYNDIYSTNFEQAYLPSLKQLEMRSNLLFDISGTYPPNVEKLYLPGNKISLIISKEFGTLTKLQILHLRENNLQVLDGFSPQLENLKYLNLRGNKIRKFQEFQKLEGLPKLETLIVTGNPLPGSDTPQVGGEGEGGKVRDPVVIPLLVILPGLKRINKTVITVEDRIDAEDMRNDILEALLKEDQTVTERGSTTTITTTDNLDQ